MATATCFIFLGIRQWVEIVALYAATALLNEHTGSNINHLEIHKANRNACGHKIKCDTDFQCVHMWHCMNNSEVFAVNAFHKEE